MRDSVAPSKPSKTEEDYAAQDDFRTLSRAEEVKSDPARHGRALKHGAKQIQTITRVIGKAKGVRMPKRSSSSR